MMILFFGWYLTSFPKLTILIISLVIYATVLRIALEFMIATVRIAEASLEIAKNTRATVENIDRIS